MAKHVTVYIDGLRVTIWTAATTLSAWTLAAAYAELKGQGALRMDTLSTAERSERMARIRNKDTKPELAVRRIVHRLGYRFRLHRKDLAGSPDLVFPVHKKAIFVHGCFWHAHEHCKIANRPKSRQEFWDAKLERNKERDKLNEAILRNDGWDVATIWECETKAAELIVAKVTDFLGHRATRKRRDG